MTAGDRTWAGSGFAKGLVFAKRVTSYHLLAESVIRGLRRLRNLPEVVVSSAHLWV